MAGKRDFNRLGKWLPPLLKKADLTPEHLGMRIGVSRTSIYNWMRDTTRPEPEVMVKVCRVLGVPFEEGLRQYSPRPRGNPYFGPDCPYNQNRPQRRRK